MDNHTKVSGCVSPAFFPPPPGPGRGRRAGGGGARGGSSNAVLVPSGCAETGEYALRAVIVAITERYGVRPRGPNICGCHSTWQDPCAAFCTPYDAKGVPR
nr:hypothetical protein StreXyl84_10380 [Streptomyces sp. Xyl84]